MQLNSAMRAGLAEYRRIKLGQRAPKATPAAVNYSDQHLEFKWDADQPGKYEEESIPIEVLESEVPLGRSVNVTDENFTREVLESKIPVLVDFWATWCGPCRMVSPIVEALATEYRGRVKVAKLDVDSSQKTASEFEITSIPTLLIFNGGEVVDQIIGAVPKKQIADKLNKILNM